MPTLNVSVVDKIATGDGQFIVCDNTDYTVKFDLDAEWDEYNAKTMRVIYPDNNYEDTLFTGDECPLPRLYNVNSIRIGIYAGDLHATAVAVFECRKSVLSEEGQHVQPPEDIYNQIMDAIENGALDGVGIDHIDKTATAGLVDTYTIYYTNETTSTFNVTNGAEGAGSATVAKTSTVGNVDTYTITMTDGATSSFTVTNGSVTSVDGMTGDVVLNYKANIDGSYDGMTVGSAQQLLANTGYENSSPYTYRATAGTTDVGDRAKVNEIDGLSLVVNQLSQATKTSSTITGITISATDNIWSFAGTMNTASTTPQIRLGDTNLAIAVGHKVYIATNNSMFRVRLQGDGGYLNSSYPLERIINTVDGTLADIVISLIGVSSGDTINTTAQFRIVDLTQLFGSASIADYVYSLEQSQSGAGVAWLRSHNIPLDIPYTTPTLMSVKTSGHKTFGFNLLPVSPAYATTTATLDKTKAVRVIPNTHYYYCFDGISTATSWRTGIKIWDMNGRIVSTGQPFRLEIIGGTMNFVTGRNYWRQGSNNTNKRMGFVFDDYYWIQMVFSDGNTSSSMKMQNASFNISNDSRNGEYEPYVEHIYPTDGNLELRGVAKLDGKNNLYADGDVYAPNGDVTRRYGVIDLGTLNWTYNAERTYFSGSQVVDSVISNTSGAICAKYLSAPFTSIYDGTANDKSIAVSNASNNHYVYVKDSSYSSAADFKAAMNGVYLLYELDTPTTEQAEPYQQVQIVNALGTEEFIDNRDIPVPVPHKTVYLPNLLDKVQHLPSLASADGSYLINQAGTQMSLELFQIPKAPSQDGSYRLKATVLGGTPVYSWEEV
jgi:hypothetical protein